MPVSGLAVTYTAIGGIILWSGIKGETLTQTIKDVSSGKAPSQNTQQIGSPSIGIASSGSNPSQDSTSAVTSSEIANDALKYAGHAYLYGGAPGQNGTNPWDCSSFCNWVLGHDLGLKLPGNSSPGYNGTTHGPSTLSYLGWSNATTVGNTASAAQAGDLCVWQTHMGIAIGNGQMISALNEHLGTRVTPINGQVTGELLLVRRIKSLSNAMTTATNPYPGSISGRR